MDHRGVPALQRMSGAERDAGHHQADGRAAEMRSNRVRRKARCTSSRTPPATPPTNAEHPLARQQHPDQRVRRPRCAARATPGGGSSTTPSREHERRDRHPSATSRSSLLRGRPSRRGTRRARATAITIGAKEHGGERRASDDGCCRSWRLVEYHAESERADTSVSNRPAIAEPRDDLEKLAIKPAV